MSRWQQTQAARWASRKEREAAEERAWERMRQARMDRITTMLLAMSDVRLKAAERMLRQMPEDG
jgi:hypothetical protein